MSGPVRLNGGAFIDLNERTMLHNALKYLLFSAIQIASKGTLENRGTTEICTSLGTGRDETIQYYVLISIITIRIPNTRLIGKWNTYCLASFEL